LSLEPIAPINRELKGSLQQDDAIDAADAT